MNDDTKPLFYFCTTASDELGICPRVHKSWKLLEARALDVKILLRVDKGPRRTVEQERIPEGLPNEVAQTRQHRSLIVFLRLRGAWPGQQRAQSPRHRQQVPESAKSQDPKHILSSYTMSNPISKRAVSDYVEIQDLANWLTHQGGATRPDAEIVLDATQNVIDTFGTAVMRHESGAPEKCPECGSYSLDVGFEPERMPRPYILECENCGWQKQQDGAGGGPAA